jgi:hypothetical protein
MIQRMKTKRLGFARALVCALMIAIPLAALGRLMQSWSCQQMFDQSDLVAIAKPLSTTDTTEKTVLPNIAPDIHVVGVETKFEVRLVTKGDTDTHSFTLHHYRLEDTKMRMMNAPMLAAFDPNENHRYLLFLKKEADGRYAPVSGQTDPDGFSIIKLGGFVQ